MLMIVAGSTMTRRAKMAKVEAGRKHSLRNLGDTEMLVLTVYDPPCVRA
jgi:hypothetical protein